MLISRVIAPLTLLLIAACTLTQNGQVVSTFTPQSTPSLQTTLVPTQSRNLHAVESLAQSTAQSIDAVQCDNAGGPSSTRYSVVADMDYPERFVIVEEQIEYTNRSQVALPQLVINVKPNIWPGVFRLTSLQISNYEEAADFVLAQQRLSIELPQPLNIGCTIVIRFTFQLTIPLIDIGGTNAYHGYLGYSNRQINLGQWLPVVAARNKEEWVSHQEIPIGEQDVLDEVDWDITLKIKNSPPNITVAAPGFVEVKASNEWHFSLPEARDFSLSIGENYRIIKQTSRSGVEIEVYSFDDALLKTDNGDIDSAAFALDTATKSLETFEDLYGDYPHERLVIVQGDFPDGMEFSGIVFVGGEYFRGFGGPDSYLMVIAAHEVAHQWWYGRIGNDQAIHPWLDEALATYSEYTFIEEYYPALKDWWWEFRVNHLSPEGFVDSTVYEFSSRRAYINAVYLRGVRMLDELRNNLGTEQFFGWLRRYAEAGAGQIMTPEQFWSFLTSEQLNSTAETRQRFLRRPQIIADVTAPPCSASGNCTSQ